MEKKCTNYILIVCRFRKFFKVLCLHFFMGHMANGDEDFEEMLAEINHLDGDAFLLKIGDYSIIFRLRDIENEVNEKC